jgi:hypothetical protein
VVDLEVWDSSWNKVFKQFWDNQSFIPGVSRSFVTSWTVPASIKTGTYTLTVGEFSHDWATNYNWINAATLTVN